MTTAPDPQTARFAALLQTALTDPGIIHAAYSAFHGFSLGNQLLAAFECAARGLPLGPIATFPGWKAKGRHVKKGEKAISLCMPVTCKRKDTDREPAGDDTAASEPGAVFTRFVFRPNWFVMAQTDGAELEPVALPAWEEARALAALDIVKEPFHYIDGNCQGYARRRSVAVSPVAALPLKTLVHEIAHVVLGHTAELAEMSDNDRTPRDIRELEAEGTAMLVLDALSMPGAEHCRGYMQMWNRTGEPIPERSAARIFKTADTILRAGRPAEARQETR